MAIAQSGKSNRVLPKVAQMKRDRQLAPLDRTTPLTKELLAKLIAQFQKPHSVAPDIAALRDKLPQTFELAQYADLTSDQSLRCSKVLKNEVVLVSLVFPVNQHTNENASDFAYQGRCSKLNLPLV